MPSETYLASFATRQIETAGARIHLATGGSGPPLLLLTATPKPTSPGTKSRPGWPSASPWSRLICAAMATLQSRTAASAM